MPRLENPRWSLSRKLTLWYMLSTTGLALLLFQCQRLALFRTLDHEDDELLQNDLRRVELVLSHAGAAHANHSSLNSLWKGRDFEPVYLRVTTADGTLVFSSAGYPADLPIDAFPVDFRGPEGFTTGISAASDSGRHYRLKAARFQRSGDPAGALLLQIALDRTKEDAIFTSQGRNAAGLAAISIALTLALGTWIIRTTMRPFHDLASMLDRFGPSNLGSRLRIGPLPPELETLARAFNDLLKRLDDAFTRLSQFSNDIAHELRSPLNLIRGELEIALSRERTVEEYQEVLSNSLESTVRISEIITSLLFLARNEGSPKGSPEATADLSSALRPLEEIYNPLAAEEGVQFQIDIPDAISVHSDATLLQRAIGNLVENAIVHSGKGSVVRLSVRARNGHAEIVVSDTGRGIPEAALPRIFDRFYQVDQVRSSANSRRGVGLGLAISRSIISLHGGTIEVESRLGAGTRFVVRLPLSGAGQRA